MREIKLRAWDESTNRMLDHDYLLKHSCKNVFMVYGDSGRLMQSTGLKDKNGVDIYESDIIKGTSRINEDWSPLQKVTFLNGCFMFGNWNAHEYFNKHTNIEIVGNVYENSDLLENKE